MKVEKIPLEKKEKQIETVKNERKNWLKINSQVSRLENSSKTLYGLDNPFNQKIAESSDPDILSASTTKEAQIQKLKLKIHDVASADRLKSSSLPSDFIVPKGKYSFGVGDKNISFYFRGGSTNEFVNLLNSKGKNLVKASSIKISKENQILIVESLLTGKSNTLKFLDDAKKLALETEMITNQPSKGFSQIFAENLILKNQEQKKIELPDLQDRKGELKITFHFNELKDDSTLPPTVVPSPSSNIPILEEDPQTKSTVVPSSGSVTLEDVTLFQATSFADLKNKENPEDPISENETTPDSSNEADRKEEINQTEAEKLLENTVVILNRLSQNTPVEIESDLSKKQTLSLDIEDIQDIHGITFKNIYPDKELIIDSVYFDDGTGRDYTPQGAINLASDAKLEYNGVIVTRPSNNIDDLVYGVKLNIQESSSKEIEIDVRSDIEAIKNSIFEYVYNYNKTIEAINVYTSSDESVIDELTYLEDDEKDELRENLGIMRGDTTLNRLKDLLKRTTTNLWKHSPESEISLLADIGIASNITGPGTFTPNKMRGYLEVDEDKLDDALSSNIGDIKEFFGTDTDNDLIIDSGLAFNLSKQLQGYTMRGGIISTKVGTYDSRLKVMNSDVEDLEEKLKDTEKEYKIKFGRMEGAMENLKKNSKSLDSLNQNQN